jgi:hypothetical protein
MKKIFNPGKYDFIWWIGIVEDRMDPEKMGRCRVRIYGYHSDSKVEIPTEDLPWAIPIQPIYSAAISGVGISPVGPLPGTWVVGFFLDGEDAQQPAFFGTLGTKSAPVVFTPKDEKVEVINKNEGKLLDGSGNPVTDGSGNPIVSGVPPVEGWELGQTSEKYETGGRGPGTVNNYLTSNDFGGASYGSYQLASYLPEVSPSGKRRPSSKNSPVLSYLKASKFRSQFEGLTPATTAFDSKWRELASSNRDAFEKDQHDYVQKVYYDVMIANLKRKGLDLTGFGPSVQDLVWSTAVQFGPGKTSIFTVPLEGKSKLTDRDIVTLVSEYKLANADSLFKSSGPAIIASVKTRYTSEKNDLINLITV